MEMINRSALVVKPGQPFLDWLHRVDRTSVELTREDLRREPTIYLLPEWETEREALEYLACVSNEIFEEQLNGWCPLFGLEIANYTPFSAGSSAASIR